MDSQIIPDTSLNVFITGATTALGLALSRLLSANGHHVAGAIAHSAEAGVVRAAGGTPAYPNLYRAGELRSAIQGTASKVVINIAPQAPNQAPQVGAQWDEQINSAAEALLTAAKAAGAEYVIHTSYAFAEAETTDETEAVFPFLKSARLAERAVLSSDLPACVLRLGFNYGAETPAMKTMTEAVRMGRAIEPGSHEPANWIYIADAAAAIYRAVLARPAHVTLDIVDDQPASPAEFFRLLTSMQGLPAPEKAPRFFLRSPYSKVHAALMKLHLPVVDNAAAKATLDWAPQYPTIEAGIDDLLVTWRAALPVTA